MNLLAMLLPSLIPAGIDLVKSLAGRLIGDVKPATVADKVKLMEAETAKLQALAALDAPAGQVSEWVADLRASFRYLAAGIIIIATLIMCFVPNNAVILGVLLEMSSSVFAFMFGDRVYLKLKNGK